MRCPDFTIILGSDGMATYEGAWNCRQRCSVSVAFALDSNPQPRAVSNRDFEHIRRLNCSTPQLSQLKLD